MVSRWVQLQREQPTSTPAHLQEQANRTSQSMAPRHLAWWFLRDPKRLEKQEKQTLSLIRTTPNVETASRLAQQLIAMVKERNSQPLSTWRWDCQMSAISDLVTFAQG